MLYTLATFSFLLYAIYAFSSFMTNTLRAYRRQRQINQISRKSLREMTNQATTLVIIRHGETEWNLNQIIQGQTDEEAPLNNQGLLQADAITHRLARFNLKTKDGLENLDVNLYNCKLYSSDLLRARQTAEFFEQAFKTKAVWVPGLRERNLGNLQGHTRQEAKVKQPEAWAALQSHDPNTPIPENGESASQFFERVCNTLQQIADENAGQTVLVVTHGGPLRIMHQYITGIKYNDKNFNCALNIVKIEGSKRAVIKWGDVEHLQEVGYNQQGSGGGSNGL
eukprot:TRINITY_DN7191_c0_g2_i1.p1 TRINITY_DN7191_c0_g2~~TRINITY_DN7191_c0_g2_i1.p1  ORF type:complete len:281 (-),score=27.36 TRINITY_DN7191_c0_g2_i1:357-1199(-)